MKNKKYKHFKKNEKYYFKKGKRIERGIYQGRFFNKEINQWIYKFKGLELGVYYTLFDLDEYKFWQLS